MILTNQDRIDIKNGLLGLAIFLLALLSVCLYLANAVGIQFDSARQLVAAIVSIFCLLYVSRNILSIYKGVFISLFTALFLIGAYSATADLYIKHSTFLGVGDIPFFFNLSYFSVLFTSLVTFGYFVKRDFFTI